jgi:DNA-binding transcriptional MerR regulator
MIVNELALKSSVPAHVIRYYSRIGLLKPSRNPENGYKLFRNDDVRILHFIRQAKDLGFTLNEISSLLEQVKSGDSPCSNVRQLLERHIELNRAEIKRLQATQIRMEDALVRWQHIPDGKPDEESLCPLIESIFH